jgi:hypothetical protein
MRSLEWLVRNGKLSQSQFTLLGHENAELTLPTLSGRWPLQSHRRLLHLNAAIGKLGNLWSPLFVVVCVFDGPLD